jgi:hypothetical protein
MNVMMITNPTKMMDMRGINRTAPLAIVNAAHTALATTRSTR